MKLKLFLLFILFTLIAFGFYMYVLYYNKEDKNYINVDTPMVKRLDSTSIYKDNKVEEISPININYLRSLKYAESEIIIEEELPEGSNYKQYLASYKSDGYKIYGLLTIPTEEPPEGGFSAIVFNHGYIPPEQYKTTSGYVAYVDYLAKNGFVVFKIDLRGNGDSEGISTGSYFSPAYMIDAIYALKALQKYDSVNPNKIGIWGHSMSGNLVLRAMLVSSEFKAGVIWSGAVYSYEDFAKYGISDNSYIPRQRTPEEEKEIQNKKLTETSEEVKKLRNSPDEVDFESDFWKGISLTKNISYLIAPIQLHHAANDMVVDVNYSRDLAEILKENKKDYEYIEYEGGGHNIDSPYFEQAIQSTTDFFKKNL